MYLHVGNNKSIRKRDIIGIFDTDNATRAALSKKFLTDAEKRGDLISVTDEIPKSFILCRKNNTVAVCLSQLSVTALAGRMNDN